MNVCYGNLVMITHYVLCFLCKMIPVMDLFCDLWSHGSSTGLEVLQVHEDWFTMYRF